MAKKKSKPGERVFVEKLELLKARDHYSLRLVTTDGFETTMISDDLLGSICSAWSVALKGIATWRGDHVQDPITEMKSGNIVLNYYNIRPVSVWPYAWHLVMHGHGYKFEANVDRDLEHVIAAYSAAMKFFSYKLGLTVVYDEVIRNRDAAAEQGFLPGGVV